MADEEDRDSSYKILSGIYIAPVPAYMQVYAYVLGVFHPGSGEIRTGKGFISGHKKDTEVSSGTSWRVRPRSINGSQIIGGYR